MIAYFDTSAVIPLLVEEPASEVAASLWDEADRLVAVSLVYAEARAALARARRLDRLTARDLRGAVRDLDSLYAQVDRVSVTETLVAKAGELAELHALRGYDAVHLAGGVLVADSSLVFVTGDATLGRAAHAAGLATASLS